MDNRVPENPVAPDLKLISDREIARKFMKNIGLLQPEATKPQFPATLSFLGRRASSPSPAVKTEVTKASPYPFLQQNMKQGK